MGTEGSGTVSPVPQMQTTAILQQAAAVQNTWYTILDTTLNCRIINMCMAMQTLAEDIQMRLTIDGTTWTGSQAAAVAGTLYYGRLNEAGDALWLTTTNYTDYRAFILEGRSVKIEMRKTTANGANRLDGYAIYARW